MAAHRRGGEEEEGSVADGCGTVLLVDQYWDEPRPLEPVTHTGRNYHGP